MLLATNAFSQITKIEPNNHKVTVDTPYPSISARSAYIAVTIDSDVLSGGSFDLYFTENIPSKASHYWRTRDTVYAAQGENHIFLFKLPPGNYEIFAIYASPEDKRGKVKRKLGPRAKIHADNGYITYIGGYNFNVADTRKKYSCVRVVNDYENIKSSLAAKLGVDSVTLQFRTELMQPKDRKKKGSVIAVPISELPSITLNVKGYSMTISKISMAATLISCLFLLPMAANAKPKKKIYINQPIYYTTSNTPMGAYDSSVSHVAFRAHSDTQAKGEIRLTITKLTDKQ